MLHTSYKPSFFLFDLLSARAIKRGEKRGSLTCSTGREDEVSKIHVAFDEVERKPNFWPVTAELVALYKVLFWKTPIPVRTPKWPPA